MLILMLATTGMINNNCNAASTSCAWQVHDTAHAWLRVCRDEASRSPTATVPRRTNGVHLSSVEGVKASQVPEGYLYETVAVPEEELRAKVERANPSTCGGLVC